jgi:hypothetical protein
VRSAPGFPRTLFSEEGEIDAKPRAHRAARMRTFILRSLKLEYAAAFFLLPLWEKVARSAG